MQGTGTAAIATIAFESAGEKRVLVGYAPLRKVQTVDQAVDRPAD